MKNENTDKRDVLLCLSVSCDGDIDDMIDSIVKKKDYHFEDIGSIKKTISSSYMTILDADYPEKLSKQYKPPLVLYYKGDIGLLQDTARNVAVLNGKNTCDYATKSLVSIIEETQGIVAVVLPVSDTAQAIVSTCINTGIRVVLVSDKAINSEEYSNSQKALIDTVLCNNGLLLSEIPDNSTNKCKKYYQMRLVSLCSSTTLVGGVSKRDSYIHAIAISLEKGDDVYCIPFEIGSNYINNYLIRDGAFLVQKGEDIIFRTNTGA